MDPRSLLDRRYLLPFVAASWVVVLILGATAVVDDTQRERFDTQAHQEAGLHARAVSADLERVLAGQTAGLEAAARELSNSSAETFAQDARAVSGLSGLDQLLLVVDGHVEAAHPGGTEPLLDTPLHDDPRVREAWFSALVTGEPRLVGPLGFDGDARLIGLASLSGEASPSAEGGAIVASFEPGALMSAAGIGTDDPGFRVAVLGPGTMTEPSGLLAGEPDVLSSNAESDGFQLAGGTWEVAAVPADGWPTNAPGTWSFRLGGGLAAVLAGSLVWMLVSEPARLREKVEEATDAVQRSERRFRQLYEEAPLAYLTLDEEGRIQRANDRVREVFGYEPGELEGRRMIELFAPGATGVERAREVLESFQAGDSVRGEELEMHTADGSSMWVNFSVRPLSDAPDQEGPRTLSMVLDITDRKRAEEQLNLYARELERSNSDLEQFAYVVSHDLKEPLRMVQSYLDLIERRAGEALEPEILEFLAFATDGAERMDRLIRDLLAYSRIGTHPNTFEPVDLEAVLDDVLADLSVRIQDAGATVEHGELPTVTADAGQMRQLLQNLVSNGIKYGGSPPVVEVAAADDGDTWTLTIEDNGSGIPPKAREQVFEIFHRLEGRPGIEGTGVGLAICKRIVERHGGSIAAEEGRTGGARFVVTIPCDPARQQATGLSAPGRADPRGPDRRT